MVEFYRYGRKTCYNDVSTGCAAPEVLFHGSFLKMPKVLISCAGVVGDLSY